MKMVLLKVFIYSLCLCSMATSLYSPNQVQDILSGFNFENTTFVKSLTETFQDNFSFLDTEKQYALQSLFENAPFVKDIIRMFQNKTLSLEPEKDDIIYYLFKNSSFVVDLIKMFQNKSSSLNTEKRNMIKSSLVQNLSDLFQNDSLLLGAEKQTIQGLFVENKSLVNDLIELFQKYAWLLDTEKQNIPEYLLNNTTFIDDLLEVFQKHALFQETEKQNLQESLFGDFLLNSFVEDLTDLFQQYFSFLEKNEQIMQTSLLENTSLVEDMMELFKQYSPYLNTEIQSELESALKNTLFVADLVDLLENTSPFLDTTNQNVQDSLLENSTFIEDLIGLFQHYFPFLENENSAQIPMFQDIQVLQYLIDIFQRNSSFNSKDIEKQNVLDSILSGTLESLVSSILPAFKDSDNIPGMNTVLYAAQAFLQTQRVSEKCRNDIGLIFTNIIQHTEWALRMVDATGKPESGILEGNLKWLGNYQECLDIRAVTDSVEHFKGKYCKIKVLGTPPSLEVGTCTSDACSASDIVGILMTVQNLLLDEKPLFHTEVSCSDSKTLPTDFIVCIGLLCMLLSLIIFGTLYDALAVQMKTKNDTKDVQMVDSLKPEQTGKLSLFQPTHSALPNAYINGGFAETEAEKGTLNGGTKKIDKEKPADTNGVTVTLPPTDTGMTSMPVKQRSTAAKILLAFSFYKNGVKILDTNQAAGSLGAINGIRFLSMAWVILGHTYYFCIGYDENLYVHFYKSMQNWTFMAITNATVAVDSFFALSGLLVAYLTLKELKKVGGARKLNWFMFYFHRFWRLTPVYMSVLMVGTVILPYILNGPMWTDSEMPFMNTCRKYWWTNLLYINNYVGSDEPCMGWSWYLSNDMQFYVISPLMVLPLFYNQIVGAVSCMIFLTATTVTAGFVAYSHRYPAQTVSPYAPQPNDQDFMQNLYLPSYARLGPYVVGLFTGYILYRTKCKCRIPKIVNLACWLLAFAICCLCVYTPYTNEDSHILTAKESAAYFALHRTGWGLAVCWIAFACATGHGGWIHQLLSWKAFVPLARLTYSAYLIHPLVMLVFYMSRNSATYFSIYEVIYLFLGNLALSYGIGFIVSLMFESPMMGLEKALIKRERK